MIALSFGETEVIKKIKQLLREKEELEKKRDLLAFSCGSCKDMEGYVDIYLGLKKEAEVYAEVLRECGVPRGTVVVDGQRREWKVEEWDGQRQKLLCSSSFCRDAEEVQDVLHIDYAFKTGNFNFNYRLCRANSLYKLLQSYYIGSTADGAATYGNDNCPYFQYHFDATVKMHRIRSIVSGIDAAILSYRKSNLHIKNYYNCFDFLRDLGYIDGSNSLLLKGKIACEFNTVDCIVITEYLLSSPGTECIVPLLASLLFNDRVRDSFTNSAEREVIAAKIRLNQLPIMEIYEGMSELQEKYKIPLPPPNTAISPEVFMWIEGHTLHHILSLSPFSEGVIIKYIKKTVELCTEVGNALRVIGNTELLREIERVVLLMKRGIVFTPSLYY